MVSNASSANYRPAVCTKGGGGACGGLASAGCGGGTSTGSPVAPNKQGAVVSIGLFSSSARTWYPRQIFSQRLNLDDMPCSSKWLVLVSIKLPSKERPVHHVYHRSTTRSQSTGMETLWSVYERRDGQSLLDSLLYWSFRFDRWLHIKRLRAAQCPSGVVRHFLWHLLSKVFARDQTTMYTSIVNSRTNS